MHYTIYIYTVYIYVYFSYNNTENKLPLYLLLLLFSLLEPFYLTLNIAVIAITSSVPFYVIISRANFHSLLEVKSFFFV